MQHNKASDMSINISQKILKDLLNDIRDGIIQVPPIQRDFVWETDKVVKLFDSINRSYPIGSIILWKPSDDTEWDKVSHIGSYDIPAKTPTPYFVLDGYQRLSSIFGCLFNNEGYNFLQDKNEWRELFNLCYDTYDNCFSLIKNERKIKEWQLPLNVILNSNLYRKYHTTHLKNYPEDEVEQILDNTDVLINKLLGYKIVCIELENATISEAAEVFNRINSQGTRVSLDWVVQALSYNKSKDFDLREIINKLIDDLQPYHFEGIERDAIFHCFQSSFDDKLYFEHTSIEELVQKTDFHSTIKEKSIPAILKAVEFLYRELHVIDYKLLPYDIQLSFIMRFFMEEPNPSSDQTEYLKQWFWKSTYSNFFTNARPSVQQKEYIRLINKLREQEDPYPDNEQYLSENLKAYPSKMNYRYARTKALSLFVINRLFEKVPNIMQDAFFTITKVKNKEPKTARNILFTDVEANAYKHITNYNQSQLEAFGVANEAFISVGDDLAILDAAFFDLNDISSLTKRNEKMKNAEKQFLIQLGFYTKNDQTTHQDE